MNSEPIRGIEEGGGNAGYCPECKQSMPDGPDICLGYIPGVSHACCGHGGICEPYAVLGGEPDQSCREIENMVVLRGAEALTFFDIVRHAREREENRCL